MEYRNIGRAVLAIVIILLFIFRRRPWKKLFVYPRKLSVGKLFRIKSLLWIAGIMMCVLRAFDMQRSEGMRISEQPHSKVLFVLDGSLSMSADDVTPNRFTRATELINAIAASGKNTSHGLIVFSGLPVVRIPWSYDIVGFTTVVSGLSLGDFPPTDTFLGTALGDALLLAVHQLGASPGSADGSSIVVISDGDSNKGYDPYKVLELIEELQIPVYFVAIGEEGYQVGTDAVGLPVITSFDTELMLEFTERTDGKLYMNPDVTAVNELTAALALRQRGGQVVYLPQMVKLNDILEPRLLVVLAALFVLNIFELLYLQRRKQEK